jgi:thiol-disulfide isomerase/thioredoxin
MNDGPTPSPTPEPAPEPAATAEPAVAPPPAAARRVTPARLLFALVAVAALAALFWPRDGGGRKAPSGGFLVYATGRPTPLGRELKPATLVHFWATWCAPCVTEIPSLLAYGREAASDRLGLVLIAVEDEVPAAQRFLGEVPFPVLFDPNWDVAHRFGTRQLPETHLVVGGRIVHSFIGATDWSDPKVRARVARALEP